MGCGFDSPSGLNPVLKGCGKSVAMQWLFGFSFIRQCNIRKNARNYGPFSAFSCIFSLFDFRIFFSCASHIPNSFRGTANTSVASVTSPRDLQGSCGRSRCRCPCGRLRSQQASASNPAVLLIPASLSGAILPTCISANISLHFLLSRDIKIAALVINKSCFMGSRFACGDGRGFYVFC